MAVLENWQRIDRVLAGLPFGNGADGVLSSATIPTILYDSCSGTAGATTLTTTGTVFANGDIIMVWQVRGTGAGQWEINRITSGSGTTTLSLQTALHNTYTDSGNSQAQAIKIRQYTSVTVETGTWTIPNWDGNTGGIFPFACNGDFTQIGSINGNGTAGAINGGVNTGRGFSGGYSRSGANNSGGGQGEGSAGAGGELAAANGSGGGGGINSGGGFGRASGGGGGYATAGSGGAVLTTGTGGSGGSIIGSDDLIALFLGSGGGGGMSTNGGEQVGSGGTGGAVVVGFIRNIASLFSISVNGGAGGNSDQGTAAGGGAGSGGSVLIVCQSGSFGPSAITALGATGGTPGGGSSSAGRIAIHHSGTITGVTNPTFTNINDITLTETSDISGGIIMI